MTIFKRTLAILIILAAASAQAATLVLKRAWIENFKDRATIDASFLVDRAHKQANAAKDDGDMHVAGRAPKEIGLPMVAEIMNAREETGAVKLIHDNEGKAQSTQVSGAWRVWFEHPPSTGSQIQFATVPPAANTNPDHCFEIHPVTKVGSIDLAKTLRHIEGFTPKDPDKAFAHYEGLSVTLKATTSAVTLSSTKSGFNYVRFVLRATSKRTNLKDGGFALTADVGEENGDEDEILARNVRMIFVPGSPPWMKVQQGLQIGDEMDVVGIPRVNLNAISKVIGSLGASTVTRKLPYEMIIVSLEK